MVLEAKTLIGTGLNRSAARFGYGRGCGHSPSCNRKLARNQCGSGRSLWPARVERRLAAVLAADVVGYSRLMGIDEEGTLAALKTYRREIINSKIAEHRGRIVKTTGDGALVEFASAVDAVRCAMEIQRAMAERNAAIPEDRRIELRIGINVGDVIIEKQDIYGDGVNIAARLEGIAKAGGICISRQVFDQIEGKLQFASLPLGPQNLKNITKPIEVLAIEVDGTGEW